MFVLVDDAPEALMSAEGEVRDLVWIGERFRAALLHYAITKIGRPPARSKSGQQPDP
jgi:hypothetical protein